MTSPAPVAVDDGIAAKTNVRRSRRSLRVLGCLAAIVALAFANTACTPQDVARDAIKKYWGGNAACAERIVQRESNYQADAVNPYSGTIGLFQIHPTHATWIKSKFGYSFSELKDPYKNSQVAKELSYRAYVGYGDGWQPWRTSGRIAPGGGCPA